MKVRLVAFGKLKSDIMEWPEETPPTIHLPMMMRPDRDWFRQDKDLTLPIHKVARFEWNGHTESDTRARIYDLVEY